jgi:hypothetical protein
MGFGFIGAYWLEDGEGNKEDFGFVIRGKRDFI